MWPPTDRPLAAEATASTQPVGLVRWSSVWSRDLHAVGCCWCRRNKRPAMMSAAAVHGANDVCNGGAVRLLHVMPLSSGSKWHPRLRGGLQRMLAAGVNQAGGEQPAETDRHDAGAGAAGRAAAGAGQARAAIAKGRRGRWRRVRGSLCHSRTVWLHRVSW